MQGRQGRQGVRGVMGSRHPPGRGHPGNNNQDCADSNQFHAALSPTSSHLWQGSFRYEMSAAYLSPLLYAPIPAPIPTTPTFTNDNGGMLLWLR